MPSSSSNDDDTAAPLPDEQAPLLSNGKPLNNGTLEDSTKIPDPPADTPLAEEHTTIQLIIIQAPIYLGCFLAALDSTLVATLSAAISTSFHSFTLLSWLASSYFISTAALQPLSGKLTDIFSRRTGLVLSNVFFAAGNLICGLAKSENMMILGRVVSGMGGGGLTAISTFVGSDLVPLRRRGVWQGVGNVFFGVGAGVGGLYGGWIDDKVGWRWAFLIQVPFTVISGFLVFFLVKIPVKKSETSRLARIDFLGAMTLVAMLVMLLLGLNSGGNVVPWSHPLVISSLSLSAVLLGAFIWIESSYAVEPVIPVKLLLNRTVAAACLTNWFATMAQYGVLFYAPIYFQVRGMSPTQAGERLIASAAGTGIGSIACGMYMRWAGRYYGLSATGLGVFVLGLGLICSLTLTTPVVPPFIYLFFLGAGYACMLTVTLLALISAVDHSHHSVVTSASYAFRSTGSSIGITIASSVFQNVLKSQLWKNIGDRSDAAELIPRLRDNLEEIKTLPPGLKEQVMDSYMFALRSVFLTCLGLGVLGWVISLFMREHRLHRKLDRRGSETSR